MTVTATSHPARAAGAPGSVFVSARPPKAPAGAPSPTQQSAFISSKPTHAGTDVATPPTGEAAARQAAQAATTKAAQQEAGQQAGQQLDVRL